jgi:general secretion pathway protein B
MSLILDALKKSEAERQRQSGPTLLEVRVAKRQRRYPLWALGVAVLLAVNMILLLVFVLRPSDSAHPPSAAAAPVPAPSVVSAQPSTSPASSSAVSPAAPTPAALTQPAAPAPVALPVVSPTLADNAANATSNPADDEPAISAASAGTRGQRDAPRIDYSNLPGINDLTGNVPDLRLDLHVYAERPRDRYALINMQTVREGDVLNEGPRVLAITPQGVALDWHNQQFMLRPQ